MADRIPKSKLFSKSGALDTAVGKAETLARQSANKASLLNERKGRFTAHHGDVLRALRQARWVRWRYVMKGYLRILVLRLARILVALKLHVRYLVSLCGVLLKIALLLFVVAASVVLAGWVVYHVVTFLAGALWDWLFNG